MLTPSMTSTRNSDYVHSYCMCIVMNSMYYNYTMYHTSLMLREYVVEARFEHVSYIVKNAPDWLLKLWKYISLILRAHVNWLTGIQYSDLCRSRIWTRVVAEIRERNIVQNAPDWRMEIFSLILRAYVYGPLVYSIMIRSATAWLCQ